MRIALAIFLLALCLGAEAAYDDTQIYRIKIPAQSVSTALTSLSEQTDVQVLFPYDIVEGQQANAVMGEFTLRQALELLLEGTGLSGGFSESRVITVTQQLPIEDEESTMTTDKNKRSLLGGIVAFLTSAVMATDAVAQGDDSESGNVLEEIIVTAQKRAQNIIDVPISVSLINSEQIDEAGNLVDIQSIQALVPSLTYRRGNTNRESALVMRGIGTISFSTGAEPAVATVVDGVVLSRSGAGFSEFSDIERIEVLKGPQGTLFGKNASGGVVNVISKGPTDEFEAGISLSYFQDNEQRYKGYVSGSLSDTVRARVNTYWGTFDGHLNNTFTGGSTQGYDRQGMRAIVDWDVTDDWRVRFIGDIASRRNDCCTDLRLKPDASPLEQEFGVQVSEESRDTKSDIGTVSEGDSRGLQVNIEGEVAGGTFTSITATRVWENDAVFDLDFSQNSQTGGPVFLSSDSNFFGNGIVDTSTQRVDQFSQEFRFTSSFGDMAEYIAGLYYYSSEVDRTFTRDLTSCDTSTLPLNTDLNATPCAIGSSTYTFVTGTSFIHNELENYAAFINADIHLTDNIDAIFGARYTRDDIEFTLDRVSPAPGPAVAPSINNEGETDATDLSIRTGLNAEFSDSLSGYVTYTQGYKGPAFNTFFNQSADQVGPVSEEDVEAYEVGMKGTLGSSSFYSMAVFHAVYDGFQANGLVTLPSGAVITNLTNAGEVTTEGFEADFIWNPTDQLSLRGGLAYTDAEVTDRPIPEGATQDQIDSINAGIGTPVPFAPEWAFSLSASYDIPLSGPMDMVLNLRYNWQDEVTSDLFQDPATTMLLIDSYGILNADIGFVADNDRYSITFHARNIADENYAATVSRVAFGEQHIQVPRDADRYFGMTASIRF